MRPSAHSISRTHPYAAGWTKSHAHFAETVFRMPAFSVEALPFRWVMRNEAEAIAREWGIEYDLDLEDEADRHIESSKRTNWVQDHRNQRALLDSFFSSLVPGRSLLLLYAKDVPLLEDKRPGGRVLVGAGFVSEEIRPAEEWEYTREGPVRSIFWERAVAHSIRPSLEQGFLLPYQELLSCESLAGRSLEEFVALAPEDHFSEFSYVSERVNEDGAIAALVELARVVDLLPGVVDGPWERVQAWIGDRLAEAWRARGPYPGIGAALVGVGIERGAVIAHRLIDSLEPGANPWGALEKAMAGGGQGPAKGLLGRVGKKVWAKLMADEDRYAVLRLVSRFSLSVDQARRLLAAKERGASDRELIENPYLLYELDRLEPDGLGLRTVDRGLFPRNAEARKALSEDPLSEPVEETADDRRVRAFAVATLERAGGEGHTILASRPCVAGSAAPRSTLSAIQTTSSSRSPPRTSPRRW
jgi:hypothetical protein